MRWISPVLALCVIATFAHGQAAPNDEATKQYIVTFKEAQQYYRDGRYEDALTAVLDVEAKPFADGVGVSRYAILMLKVDTCLKLDRRPLAIGTLQRIQREYVADPAIVAEARSLEELLKKANATTLTCPPTAGEPDAEPRKFDLADPAQRKDAAKALYDLRATRVNDQYELAKGASTMAPLVESGKAVITMQALERYTTGKNKKTGEMLAALRAKATELVKLGLETEALRYSSATKDDAARVQRVIVHERLNDGRRVTEWFKVKRPVDPDDQKKLEEGRANLMGLKRQMKDITDALDLPDNTYARQQLQVDDMIEAIDNALKFGPVGGGATKVEISGKKKQ